MQKNNSLRLGTALICVFGLAACAPDPVISAEIQAVEEGATPLRLINGEYIYMEDVVIEALSLETIPLGTEFTQEHPEFETVLERLIDQKLLAQEAVRRGLDQSPAARRRLASSRERILGNFMLEDITARHVTEEDIQTLYAEQAELQQLDDEVLIHHILFEDEDSANAVSARILAGETFESLVFEHSIDQDTRLQEGRIGFVAPNDQPEPFGVIIANTAVESVSPPFESPQGWHIIKVMERRTPPPQPLEEIRPRLVSFLTFRNLRAFLQDLRREAVIEAVQTDTLQTDPAPE